MEHTKMAVIKGFLLVFLLIMKEAQSQNTTVATTTLDTTSATTTPATTTASTAAETTLNTTSATTPPAITSATTPATATRPSTNGTTTLETTSSSTSAITGSTPAQTGSTSTFNGSTSTGRTTAENVLGEQNTQNPINANPQNYIAAWKVILISLGAIAAFLLFVILAFKFLGPCCCHTTTNPSSSYCANRAAREDCYEMHRCDP